MLSGELHWGGATCAIKVERREERVSDAVVNAPVQQTRVGRRREWEADKVAWSSSDGPEGAQIWIWQPPRERRPRTHSSTPLGIRLRFGMKGQPLVLQILHDAKLASRPVGSGKCHMNMGSALIAKHFRSSDPGFWGFDSKPNLTYAECEIPRLDPLFVFPQIGS